MHRDQVKEGNSFADIVAFDWYKFARTCRYPAQAQQQFQKKLTQYATKRDKIFKKRFCRFSPSTKIDKKYRADKLLC